MATTYDKASLVMLPSGYKDDKLYSIKPTDGSGDFTFSRDGAGASPATRVNASGLIEKGRTNEVLQSNTFNTTWSSVNVVATSGQSGYDGSSDAWKLEKFAASGNLQQAVSASGVHTLSFYAKAGNRDWTRIIATGGSSTPSTWFDLANGVVGTADFFTIDSNIESVGGDWYRCSITFEVGSFTGVRVYPADGNNDVSGTNGYIYIQDAQLESGLVATDVIETTTAPVSAGLLGDMPRLDYSGGATCPSLLLEPSRVNLFTQSEYFRSWSTAGTTPVFTNNYGISPEGLQNSTRVQLDNGDIFYQAVNLSQGAYVFSVFGKAISGGSSEIILRVDIPASIRAVFDLSNGTIVTNTSDDADIIDYGNGWYRCILIQNNDTILNAVIEEYDDSLDCEIYGAQVEAGSYVSSYIPTYGSASTRGKDALSLTDLQGNGILPALNEGTLFLDLEVSGKRDSAGSYRHFRLVDNIDSANNRIRIWEGSAGVISSIRVDFSGTNIEHSFNADTPNKLAVSWGAGGTKIFLNGSVTDSVATRLAFASTPKFLTNILSNYRFDQILLFPTELTQAEVETLTTL